MSNSISETANQDSGVARVRRAWVRPVAVVLPKLSELTLQSPGAIPGGGGTGGGGSTVIP